jgi:cell division septum initiation protein DivIVA
MDLKRFTRMAKDVVDKRGGNKALKEDAAELKDIATGPGSMSEKAKRAADAVKEPGAAQHEPPRRP